MATMMKLAALAAAMLFAASVPTLAAPMVPDQTVARWTETEPMYPDDRMEYAMSVHSGTIEVAKVQFGPTFGPEGDKSSFKIALSRVKRFTADTFVYDGTTYYRIGVYGLSDKDLIGTTWYPGEGATVIQIDGVTDFAVFTASQRSQRDEVFKKLCGMIGETPTIP